MNSFSVCRQAISCIFLLKEIDVNMIKWFSTTIIDIFHLYTIKKKNNLATKTLILLALFENSVN